MKAPVLVVGPRAAARAVAGALQSEFTVTVEEDAARARARAVLGADLVVVTVGGARMPGALELDASSDAASIVRSVVEALARSDLQIQQDARDDDIGAIKYEDYLKLVRYAMTRRYLASMLARHRGSVTAAARAAGLERESLHRLLRRHHMNAEDFRDR